MRSYDRRLRGNRDADDSLQETRKIIVRDNSLPMSQNESGDLHSGDNSQPGMNPWGFAKIQHLKPYEISPRGD